MFLFHPADVFSSFWYIIGLFVRPETIRNVARFSAAVFSENDT